MGRVDGLVRALRGTQRAVLTLAAAALLLNDAGLGGDRALAQQATGESIALSTSPAAGALAENAPEAATSAAANGSPSRRASRFLAGREVIAAPDGTASAAAALAAARGQHAVLASTRAIQASPKVLGTGVAVRPRLTQLNAAWQPVGPGSVTTAAYGAVSGRVTSVAIDPADATGNTVYVGTTGGGVWKSTNAAGPASASSFVPLTDMLPVFSANAGNAAVASLSIGALSVQGGVILAGTGDPNDATDSYYGSGVLRSADGGATWTLAQQSQDGVGANHTFVGLGFAGFAWSSVTPGLVVGALSDAAEGRIVNAVNTQNAVRGIYYSSDSGLTWHMAVVTDASGTVQAPTGTAGANAGYAATSVVWNSARRRFYAVLRYRGYYESADGANWTRLAAQPGAGLAAVTCLSGFSSCPVFRGVLAVDPVTGDMFALTVDSNNLDQGLWQDVCGGNGTGCTGAVAFGKRLGGTALEVGGGSARILQGDYNLSLAAVHAGADTLLYVGTEDLYRCELAAGGSSACSLRNTTNASNGCGAAAKVAPAQHALAALAAGGTGGSLPLLYVGNDGGLWRSLDGVNQQAAVCSADDATHFDNLNGGLGSLAEVARFAQHPSDQGTLLVGLGSNGTAGTGTAFAPGGSAWAQLSAGEGGTVAIDASNPTRWYISTGAGVSVKACGSGSACTTADFSGAAAIAAAQVSGDASLVDAPWLPDPVVPGDLLLGTCRVWRGSTGGGALWSGSNAISTQFGGAGPSCAGTSALIRSLAAGGLASGATSAQDAGSTVLYAGLAGSLDGGGTLAGHVFSTAAGGTAGPTTVWADSATSIVTNDAANSGRFNPGGFDVSALTVDSHDATGKTVYATVMGFSGNGISAPHVYRSVDGGAHWLNVSGNLPGAPANDVAVDPNDANTVYVAMDTGVYVTTQIATCATSNCWSVYGTGLPNAPAVQLAAAVGMDTGDGRTGELRVGTYGRGIWQIPLLSAMAPAAPGMSVAPTSLSFPQQALGTASASQTVTVTNSGNAPLVVSQVSASGDFVTTDACVRSLIAAGATCTVQVSFLPAAAGPRSGVLTLYGNVAGGQATVALSGTAVTGGAIVLNPVTILFPATTVGAQSTARNVTISNTGGVSVGLTSVAVSGDFAVAANTCGPSLAPGVGCTVAVIFKPASAGVRPGLLTVVDDAGSQTVALTGTGTAPATDALSPATLGFGIQQLSTASAPQQVVLTNLGDVALTLIAAQVTSGDFTVVNGCGNSLNAHSTCSISVVYVPRSVGPGSGTLTVSDQFRSQTVALSGTGIAPPGVSLSPVQGLGFGALAVGSTSASQPVTLTNNGGLTLDVSAIAVTGDYILAPGGSCGNVLAAGAACGIAISFAPSAGGPRSGTLTVTDNAAGSPHTLSLTGTGVDFALVANGSTSVVITSGQSAVFPLLLSSAPNVPGSVNFSCSGAPANAVCSISPSTAALGGATTVSVTLSTGVTVASAMQRAVPSKLQGSAGWLACLLPLGLLLRRRKILGLTALCLLAGCGSGRTIPAGALAGAGGGAATPAGTYALTVTASSAGMVRTIALTVVVQ